MNSKEEQQKYRRKYMRKYRKEIIKGGWVHYQVTIPIVLKEKVKAFRDAIIKEWKESFGGEPNIE